MLWEIKNFDKRDRYIIKFVKIDKNKYFFNLDTDLIYIILYWK